MTDMHLAGLNGFDIVIWGYWEVPEHITTEEAREGHETEAQAVLYDMATQFSHAGSATDIRLEFGPAGAAKRASQNRLVEETDADGILLADQLTSLLNILVPLRDVRHLEEIVEFVSTFDGEGLFALELYHATDDQGTVTGAEEMLHSVEERLLASGFSEADIEITVAVADDAEAAIVERAREHNVVVIGKTQDPAAQDQFFGPVCRYIAAESRTPVIVVQEYTDRRND